VGRTMSWGRTCKVSGFSYCPGIAADRREHDKHHDAAVVAREALAGEGPGPPPISYTEREELKGGDNRTLINLMWSYFARSLGAWNYISTAILRGNVMRAPIWLPTLTTGSTTSSRRLMSLPCGRSSVPSPASIWC
jgi:hypothetical protein